MKHPEKISRIEEILESLERMKVKFRELNGNLPDKDYKWAYFYYLNSIKYLNKIYQRLQNGS